MEYLNPLIRYNRATANIEVLNVHGTVQVDATKKLTDAFWGEPFNDSTKAEILETAKLWKII